jgi:hypothetical protein
MADYFGMAQAILGNPVVMSAILALIINVGGFIAAWAKSNGTESYDKYKALETLALFEGVFIGLQGIAGLDPKWVAVIAIAVNIIYSLKKTLAPTNTTVTPAPV